MELVYDFVIIISGITSYMLAILRVHGYDSCLHDAREHGIVLAGWSSGAICWFESGVTDSFGPQLEQMVCLGFLPGSACPHYDGEELRRPRYAELLSDGLQAGIAIDDDVGVRFDGSELTEVVSSRAGATAYRVSAQGEEPFAARLLQ